MFTFLQWKPSLFILHQTLSSYVWLYGFFFIDSVLCLWTRSECPCWYCNIIDIYTVSRVLFYASQVKLKLLLLPLLTILHLGHSLSVLDKEKKICNRCSLQHLLGSISPWNLLTCVYNGGRGNLSTYYQKHIKKKNPKNHNNKSD